MDKLAEYGQWLITKDQIEVTPIFVLIIALFLVILFATLYAEQKKWGEKVKERNHYMNRTYVVRVKQQDGASSVFRTFSVLVPGKDMLGLEIDKAVLDTLILNGYSRWNWRIENIHNVYTND